MDNTVAGINADIEKDKAAFNASRIRLAMLLGPAMPKPGAEDIFIAHAFEFGPALTLQESMCDAGYFDLSHPLDKGLAAKITEALQDAHALNTRLVDNVATRENILMRKDPNHKPTYFWLGQEFTIDPKAQTMTDVETGTVYAFIRDDEPPRSPSSPSKGMSR